MHWASLRGAIRRWCIALRAGRRARRCCRKTSFRKFSLFLPAARRRFAIPEPSIVELLVVIGVMAILIAMLMPVLAGAQQASMQIVCASNLRTIGQGFSVYLSVNGGAYPPAYT
jgi:hypothetical protein